MPLPECEVPIPPVPYYVLPDGTYMTARSESFIAQFDASGGTDKHQEIINDENLQAMAKYVEATFRAQRATKDAATAYKAKEAAAQEFRPSIVFLEGRRLKATVVPPEDMNTAQLERKAATQTELERVGLPQLFIARVLYFGKLVKNKLKFFLTDVQIVPIAYYGQKHHSFATPRDLYDWLIVNCGFAVSYKECEYLRIDDVTRAMIISASAANSQPTPAPLGINDATSTSMVAARGGAGGSGVGAMVVPPQQQQNFLPVGLTTYAPSTTMLHSGATLNSHSHSYQGGIHVQGGTHVHHNVDPSLPDQIKQILENQQVQLKNQEEQKAGISHLVQASTAKPAKPESVEEDQKEAARNIGRHRLDTKFSHVTPVSKRGQSRNARSTREGVPTTVEESDSEGGHGSPPSDKKPSPLRERKTSTPNAQAATPVPETVTEDSEDDASPLYKKPPKKRAPVPLKKTEDHPSQWSGSPLRTVDTDPSSAPSDNSTGSSVKSVGGGYLSFGEEAKVSLCSSNNINNGNGTGEAGGNQPDGSNQPGGNCINDAISIGSSSDGESQAQVQVHKRPVGVCGIPNCQNALLELHKCSNPSCSTWVHHVCTTHVGLTGKNNELHSYCRKFCKGAHQAALDTIKAKKDEKEKLLEDARITRKGKCSAKSCVAQRFAYYHGQCACGCGGFVHKLCATEEGLLIKKNEHDEFPFFFALPECLDKYVREGATGEDSDALVLPTSVVMKGPCEIPIGCDFLEHEESEMVVCCYEGCNIVIHQSCANEESLHEKVGNKWMHFCSEEHLESFNQADDHRVSDVTPAPPMAPVDDDDSASQPVLPASPGQGNGNESPTLPPVRRRSLVKASNLLKNASPVKLVQMVSRKGKGKDALDPSIPKEDAKQAELFDPSIPEEHSKQAKPFHPGCKKEGIRVFVKDGVVFKRGIITMVNRAYCHVNIGNGASITTRINNELKWDTVLNKDPYPPPAKNPAPKKKK